MSDRAKACLADLSKNLEDVLDNAQAVKGENYRQYVTFLSNTATIVKILSALCAASRHPEAEALANLATSALVMNATAFGSSLKLSRADRLEAMKLAKTIDAIVKTTNEAFDNGNKA